MNKIELIFKSIKEYIDMQYIQDNQFSNHECKLSTGVIVRRRFFREVIYQGRYHGEFTFEIKLDCTYNTSIEFFKGKFTEKQCKILIRDNQISIRDRLSDYHNLFQMPVLKEEVFEMNLMNSFTLDYRLFELIELYKNIFKNVIRIKINA